VGCGHARRWVPALLDFHCCLRKISLSAVVVLCHQMGGSLGASSSPRSAFITGQPCLWVSVPRSELRVNGPRSFLQAFLARSFASAAAPFFISLLPICALRLKIIVGGS
jgi:hypothetical protein